MFLAGEIEKNSGWQQVLFPVNSSDDYDQVRVTIRNFAANNTGNDFLIDDIQIFAEKTPIRSYEANSTCADANTLMTIIRVDYKDLGEAFAGQYLYYDVYDATHAERVAIGSKGYHVGDLSTPRNEHDLYEYGSLLLPHADYNPARYNKEDAGTWDQYIGNRETGVVYGSIAEFVETTRAVYAECTDEAEWAATALSDKGYVKEIVRGEEHWTRTRCEWQRRRVTYISPPVH